MSQIPQFDSLAQIGAPTTQSRSMTASWWEVWEQKSFDSPKVSYVWEVQIEKWKGIWGARLHKSELTTTMQSFPAFASGHIRCVCIGITHN